MLVVKRAKWNKELRGKSGIYRIYNKVTGKCYIGQASNFYIRWHGHLLNFNRNSNTSHLQRAWNKYGKDKFEFQVLEFTLKDKKILCDREQYWMDFYKAYDRKCGYNLAFSSESNLGYKHTKKSIRKMRDGHTRKSAVKMVKSKGSKVFYAFLKGRKIGTYLLMKDCTEDLNVSGEHVRYYLDGEDISCVGKYSFVYRDEFRKTNPKVYGITVLVCDTETNNIKKRFATPREVANHYEIRIESVYNRINKKKKIFNRCNVNPRLKDTYFIYAKDYFTEDQNKLKLRKTFQHSLETKEKIALSKGGKKFVIFKKGKILDEFIVQSECAKKYNLNRDYISAVLCGKQKSTNGYTFKYLN